MEILQVWGYHWAFGVFLFRALVLKGGEKTDARKNAFPFTIEETEVL